MWTVGLALLIATLLHITGICIYSGGPPAYMYWGQPQKLIRRLASVEGFE
jgi:hypothetical protein